MDQKYLNYRAAKISRAKGGSLADALAIAKHEIATDTIAERQAKIEEYRATSRRLTQKLKRSKKRTTYVVGANVICNVVSGGLPTLGKR